jgi:hypothetical protein
MRMLYPAGRQGAAALAAEGIRSNKNDRLVGHWHTSVIASNAHKGLNYTKPCRLEFL